MAAAPSVSYPVGRARFPGVLAASLALAGGVGIGYWVFQSDAPGWRHALATSAALVADAAALRAWLRSPQWILQWDGAGAIEVAIDLQHLLLVRWHRQGATCWMWLERHRDQARWADLRRAVYSRARPPASPATKPPSATP
jgi:toxin CptA